ncbi:MAG: glycosyltransferase [Pseudomonadota bacterium]
MSLSIVIPIYNEEKYISETIAVITALLESLIEFEIIAVNNASSDNTADLLADIKNIKLLTLNEKVTVAKARNIGWREAKYNLVAFIDGDMIITHEWSNEIVKMTSYLEANSLTVTGCKCHPSRTPSWIENVWFTNENYRNNKEKYINSGNLITTRSVMDITEGFDERLITGEDVDFCGRARALNATLEINKNFKIHHEGYPKTLKGFVKRERWHGVGDVSSLGHFIKSKVAILSMVVLTLLIATITSMIFSSKLSTLLLLSLIFIIIVSAHYKFNVQNKVMWLQIYFLQFLYFFGRSLSITIRRNI